MPSYACCLYPFTLGYKKHPKCQRNKELYIKSVKLKTRTKLIKSTINNYARNREVEVLLGHNTGSICFLPQQLSFLTTNAPPLPSNRLQLSDQLLAELAFWWTSVTGSTARSWTPWLLGCWLRWCPCCCCRCSLWSCCWLIWCSCSGQFCCRTLVDQVEEQRAR